MVNNNIMRTPVTKNLDHIEVLIKENVNATTYFRGSDVADFKIQFAAGTTRLRVLTVEGKLYNFYNSPVNIVYCNQESLETNTDANDALNFEYLQEE